MRIAYIHQYFTTRDMPGGTRSYELARRLVDQGHEVHVVTADTFAERPSRHWRTSSVEGATVHWLPVPYGNAMSYPRRIQAFTRFALRAGTRAASTRPDVVLATSTPLTVALPGIFAARRRRVPFVFEVRDLWPELPVEVGALRNPAAIALARWLARTAYRNAAQVIALSPGMADGIAATGYPRERITVVPNAADLDLFAVAPEEVAAFRAGRSWLGDRPLLVYAGTFGTINGVGYLVRLAAAVRARDPQIRFFLVGEGREWDQTRALAAELGVLDRTVFVEPPVTKASMPALLGAATVAASVFLPLPGMEANSANKFFDALAAGRPVAVNYGGWQAELLRESGAGLVLDPRDLDAAADQLVAAVHDEVWLETAAAASSRLARERFSRDELFAAFEGTLVRAAAGGAADDAAPSRVR